MNPYKYPSLIIFFLFISATSISQDEAAVLDRAYGMDQTLYNGKKYDFRLPYGTKGNQYLFSPDFMDGSVTLKGKCYRDLTLNYDIYNQQLLLMYTDEAGARNIIEVSKAWLTKFSLGNMDFEFLDLEQKPQLYQVLGEGPVRILYYWRKNMDLDIAIGSNNYIFNRPIRDSYVFIDGNLKPYKSKRSLIGRFDPVHRQEIKRYLRKHKVNLKKSPDKIIAEMITFIGNIK